MTALRLALVVGLVCALSCARTVYTNLAPRGPVHVHDDVDRSSPPSDRNFFLFGWTPGEMVIDAENYCGGSAHVDRIETEKDIGQSAIEALILGMIAISVYAPYTGRVVCDYHAGR